MHSERVELIKANIENINSMIAEAAEKCGRLRNEIRLMAVSKTKPVEDIAAAYEAGQRLFGENRITEAAEKFAQLPSDAELHMIGHLQSNKSKTAAESAACVQSIDKFKTAETLNRHAGACGRKIDFLIEINTSAEASKNGYSSFEAMLPDLDSFLKLEHLRLRGLMTIAPFVDDEKSIRMSFRSLYNSFVRLQKESGPALIDVLSMGMSSDFKIAIEEGSTLVRVGTAIFGARFV